MTHEQYLGKTLAEMISSGVTVQFNKRIYNSKHSYNFFDDEPRPKLHINYFDDELNDWFSVYVHEYCHFLQWKKEIKKWEPFGDHMSKVNLFLDGKRKTVKIEHIRKVQELEMDCDRKAIKQIKKFKLKIDLEDYIRTSNLYIYCHNFFPKYGKFFIPFTDEMLQRMPKTPLRTQHLDYKINGLEELYAAEYNKVYKSV